MGAETPMSKIVVARGADEVQVTAFDGLDRPACGTLRVTGGTAEARDALVRPWLDFHGAVVPIEDGEVAETGDHVVVVRLPQGSFTTSEQAVRAVSTCVTDACKSMGVLGPTDVHFLPRAGAL